MAIARIDRRFTDNRGRPPSTPPGAVVPNPATPSPAPVRALLPALLLGALVALVGLGWRGIWDPDEGRYTNVAMQMLATGDYVHPHRHHETGHWTKPPLTYWAIAASVATFGPKPWAARLPAALAFLASIALVFAIARVLLPGRETLASVVYATSFLPFAASQIITTDHLLTAFVTLAVYGWVRARFAGDGHGLRWIVLMWAGFGLGFLTKGPPALLPLAAILAFHWTTPARRPVPLFAPLGLVVFVAIALPWYLVVVHDEPRLFDYFIGNEVIARVASGQHGRNPEWYGWLVVYGPTLLAGTLPWTLDALRALGGHARVIATRWRERLVPGRSESLWFLILWFALPLLVFCLARSRLPLYVLPLVAPLAILIADGRLARGRGLPAWGWLLAWAAVLLAINALVARMPTHKDARAWADHLRAYVYVPIREVVFVEDMARYGLHLEAGAEVEKLSLDPEPRPAINPDVDMDLATELAESEPDRLWITKRERYAEVERRIRELGFATESAAPDYYGRAIFRVVPGERPGTPGETEPAPPSRAD